ncbi:hypothetical protein KGF57_002984 [Candida theae]|uniref:Alpha/beta hydrolase fold-3 domain-containing protein n=1 Tax=Candida theae TaxID=1198502 RepID=A0AAD5BE27_9ASCO|nr:uncharacterized protein KGF57_002984 [Candida theae]KAI5957718.1 hypothetical protein KGF57_002984 [Candida theae]
MVSVIGIFIILGLPIRLLWTAIKYPFDGGAKGKYHNSLAKALKLAICKFAISLSVEDSSVLALVKTNFVINTIVKTLYPSLTKLNNYGKRYDEQSIWLVEADNRTKSDPIIIFCHGGGFFLETQPQHIESLLSMYYLLEEVKRERTSILVLEYGLACHGHLIGTQVHELAATYSKLALEGNDNFVLMGDSCGGNLAIVFLQLLKQEQKMPQLPWPKSLVLICPWIKIVPDKDQLTPGHSYHDNLKYDMVSENFMLDPKRQVALFGNKDYADLFISPGNVPYKASDWSDIPTLHNKGYSTFVITGEHEVFRDDALEWARYALGSPLQPPSQDSGGGFKPFVHEFETSGSDGAYIDVVVEPWGIHESAIFFEHNAAGLVKSHPQVQLKDLDPVEYFGIVRITEFLNRTLVVSQEDED